MFNRILNTPLASMKASKLYKSTILSKYKICSLNNVNQPNDVLKSLNAKYDNFYAKYGV